WVAGGGGKIALRADVVIAKKIGADATTMVVPAGGIPDDWMGLDIGPDSVQAFAATLRGAATVFWNGPMGVFEQPPFAAGTRGVPGAVAERKRFAAVGG